MAHTRWTAPEMYSTEQMTERWLLKHWRALDGEAKQSLSLKEIKMWLTKINLKLSNKDCKDYFMQVDRLKQQLIGFPDFTQLYHLIGEVPQVNELFAKHTTNGATMTPEQVMQFFAEEQGEVNVSKDRCFDIVKRYGDGSVLTVAQFVEYLHSAENTLWNTRHNEVYQDMTHPLSHYLVSSSHNTYLMGDQFRSESSVEAYIRSLRYGCRCVEIDCWDGPNNEPWVYHGNQ